MKIFLIVLTSGIIATALIAVLLNISHIFRRIPKAPQLDLEQIKKALDQKAPPRKIEVNKPKVLDKKELEKLAEEDSE